MFDKIKILKDVKYFSINKKELILLHNNNTIIEFDTINEIKNKIVLNGKYNTIFNKNNKIFLLDENNGQLSYIINNKPKKITPPFYAYREGVYYGNFICGFEVNSDNYLVDTFKIINTQNLEVNFEIKLFTRYFIIDKNEIYVDNCSNNKFLWQEIIKLSKTIQKVL